jgi:predicted transposase YdaD
MGDHDALFKRVFAVPENAAGMLRSVLPAELVAALDLSRLELLSGESITDNLDEQRADLLFRAPLREPGEDGGEECVYLPLHLLVEHQSTPPPRMPLRALRYMLPVWLQALSEDPARKTLPPVIMLVVYHGPNGWTGPRSLHEMVAGLDRFPALRAHVPNLVLLIDELSSLKDAEILARPLAPVPMTAVWLLRDSRHMDALIAHLPAFHEVLERVVRESPDEALFFLRYISFTATERSYQEFRRAILEHVPAAEAPLATIAEELKQLGRQEGRQEGRRPARRSAGRPTGDPTGRPAHARRAALRPAGSCARSAHRRRDAR